MKSITKAGLPLLMTALLTACAGGFEATEINDDGLARRISASDVDRSLDTGDGFREEVVIERHRGETGAETLRRQPDTVETAPVVHEEIPGRRAEQAVPQTQQTTQQPVKPLPPTPPPVVNAQCGTAVKDGLKFIDVLTPPMLCASGTAQGGTQVANRWEWTCLGANGGKSVACAAEIERRCFDRRHVSNVVIGAAQVHNDIAKLYTDFFGQTWQSKYHAGAKYLTRLYLEGYSLASLRRDLANDKAAVNAPIEELYQLYLGRPVDAAALTNVRNFLIGGGTLRDVELMLRQSAECQSQNK